MAGAHPCHIAPLNRSIHWGFRDFGLSLRSALQLSFTLLVCYRFQASIPPWVGSRTLVQTAVSSRSTLGDDGQSNPQARQGLPRDHHPALWLIPETACESPADPWAPATVPSAHTAWLIHGSRPLLESVCCFHTLGRRAQLAAGEIGHLAFGLSLSVMLLHSPLLEQSQLLAIVSTE